MQGLEKRNSIGHFLVSASLWFINILIVIFGSPFLIYKVLKKIFFKSAKKPQPENKPNPDSTQYVPYRIDSKF